MKLQTVMTERDKRLLYGLGLVLLIALFVVVLITPQLEKRNELALELESSTNMVMDAKDHIAQISNMQTREQELLSQWAVSCNDFYPMMGNDAVDGLVTGIVMTHGLVPRELKISDPVQTPLLPFTDAVGGTQPEKDAFTPVWTTKVTFSGEGTTEAILALVDDVNKNYPSMRITSFEIKLNKVAVDANGNFTGAELNYTFGADIYMCDKT